MKLHILILMSAQMMVACTFEGLRSPGPSGEYAWSGKNNPSLQEIRRVLDECGAINPVQRGDESIDNARARAEECVFARGFYIKSGYGGICSNPYYRAKLPACQNAPQRPREGYYGQ